MAMIDFSFLSGVVSELNFFFTNLARSEQMKDINMSRKGSKKDDVSKEDVASTTVDVTYSNESVAVTLNTNDNNALHVWKENFYIMVKTILPQKIRELISFCKEEIIEQIKPIIISELAGGMA